MSRGSNVLAVFVVASLGLWGCAQGRGGGADRLRALEIKCAKLEEDYRAVTAARDLLRAKVSALEAEQARLQQEAESHEPLLKERLGLIAERQSLTRQRDNLVRDRGELQQQVTSRTSERDDARSQVDLLRKGLRSLLGQAEASGGGHGPPSVSAAGAAAGKS